MTAARRQEQRPALRLVPGGPKIPRVAATRGKATKATKGKATSVRSSLSEADAARLSRFLRRRLTFAALDIDEAIRDVGDDETAIAVVRTLRALASAIRLEPSALFGKDGPSTWAKRWLASEPVRNAHVAAVVEHTQRNPSPDASSLVDAARRVTTLDPYPQAKAHDRSSAAAFLHGHIRRGLLARNPDDEPVRVVGVDLNEQPILKRCSRAEAASVGLLIKLRTHWGALLRGRMPADAHLKVSAALSRIAWFESRTAFPNIDDDVDEVLEAVLGAVGTRRAADIVAAQHRSRGKAGRSGGT